MLEKLPLVSIGLPVYNGENYLREALDSLLAQDYRNFELIISDNASTDSTARICQEYIERETRIRYFRADQNNGASWNFNRVLELSGGEFFMWAGHDDLWHPTFVSKSVQALLNDAEAVLCHSQEQAINSAGAAVGKPYVDCVNEENTRRKRWRKTHQNWDLHTSIYGLMRTAVLKSVTPFSTFACSDLILVAEISLHGKIVQIPEVLQFKRLPEKTASRYQSPEKMMEYLGAKSIKKIRMQRWRVMLKCILILKNAELPLKEFLLSSLDIFLIYLKTQFLIDFKELINSLLMKLKYGRA